MIKLFSYGTLCEKEVQLREFGQEFYVEPYLDYISDFEIIKVKMNGVYYNVAVPESGAGVVMGAIVHIPEEMLSKIDEYEGLEYKRIKVKTLTGTECIMYIKR